MIAASALLTRASGPGLLVAGILALTPDAKLATPRIGASGRTVALGAIGVIAAGPAESGWLRTILATASERLAVTLLASAAERLALAALIARRPVAERATLVTPIAVAKVATLTGVLAAFTASPPERGPTLTTVVATSAAERLAFATFAAFATTAERLAVATLAARRAILELLALGTLAARPRSLCARTALAKVPAGVVALALVEAAACGASAIPAILARRIGALVTRRAQTAPFWARATPFGA